MSIFLWVIYPYICLAIFVVGHVWRYRYDKFGWTTRSSQLYESKLLRIGSPLFHFGMLVVILGHFIGLVIPESWTEAVGISEHMYHWGAAVPGIIAGVATTLRIAEVFGAELPLITYAPLPDLAQLPTKVTAGAAAAPTAVRARDRPRPRRIPAGRRPRRSSARVPHPRRASSAPAPGRPPAPAGGRRWRTRR